MLQPRSSDFSLKKRGPDSFYVCRGRMALAAVLALTRYGRGRDFATRYESASDDSLTTFLPGYNLKPNTLYICVNVFSWQNECSVPTGTCPPAGFRAVPQSAVAEGSPWRWCRSVGLCVEVRLWACRPEEWVGIIPLRSYRNSGPLFSLVDVRLMGL